MTHPTRSRVKCTICGQPMQASRTNLVHLELPPRFACMDLDCVEFGIFKTVDVDEAT